MVSQVVLRKQNPSGKCCTDGLITKSDERTRTLLSWSLNHLVESSFCWPDPDCRHESDVEPTLDTWGLEGELECHEVPAPPSPVQGTLLARYCLSYKMFSRVRQLTHERTNPSVVPGVPKYSQSCFLATLCHICPQMLFHP